MLKTEVIETLLYNSIILLLDKNGGCLRDILDDICVNKKQEKYIKELINWED